eukprot:jgi/Chrzof1/10967/Cz05g18290.t1
MVRQRTEQSALRTVPVATAETLQRLPSNVVNCRHTFPHMFEQSLNDHDLGTADLLLYIVNGWYLPKAKVCATVLVRLKRVAVGKPAPGSVVTSCACSFTTPSMQGLATRQAVPTGLCPRAPVPCCSPSIRNKGISRSHESRARLHSIQAAAEVGVNGKTPAAAVKAPKKPAVDPKTQPFTNVQRFIVPKHLQSLFSATWQERESAMKHYPGFQGLSVVSDGDHVTVSSSWSSIPEWEAFSLGPEARRSHLPWGVYQYVPKKGEGFPEDFVPFVEYDEPVNAKY